MSEGIATLIQLVNLSQDNLQKEALNDTKGQPATFDLLVGLKVVKLLIISRVNRIFLVHFEFNWYVKQVALYYRHFRVGLLPYEPSQLPYARDGKIA